MVVSETLVPMMEQTVAVKEMFDGLYNIIVGPGFYTVSGAKRKRPKVSKSSHQNVAAHEDMMSSVSDQDSSKEEKEYRPSAENVGEFAYKSSAGSDSDVTCDDSTSSINGPNTGFVSHEPSNDMPRTERTVTSKHKHNNACDQAVVLSGEHSADDKSVCASLKSKSYGTKEPGCGSKYGYSKQPTDLIRSSRGHGSKNSTVSVVRVDRSDVLSIQSQPLQEGTPNVPSISHVSRKANKSELTSKQPWPLQGGATSNVAGVSHVSRKAVKSDVPSKQSQPLQEGPTDVSHVSHKANKSELTSKQPWPLQGGATSNVAGVSHVSRKAVKSDVPSKQSRPLQGEGPSDVAHVSQVSHKATRSDVPAKHSRSPQGKGPSTVSHLSHTASKSDLTLTGSSQEEEPSSVPSLSRVSHKTVLEGTDLTISSRRSLGRPPFSPEKTLKHRLQPSPSVGALKLHQEETTTASILESDDGRSVTKNDLTISSRRRFGRPSESQLSPEKSVKHRRPSSDEEHEETSLSVCAVKLQEEQKTDGISDAYIVKSGDRRSVTIPGSTPCSSKDADAQSDISTDSHASGYTQSRPAVPPRPSSGGRPGDDHRKPRKKTVPEHPHSRLSSSPVKESADKSETKISPVKRKRDADSSENLYCKKVKSNHRSREKSSKSKMTADKHKKQTPTRRKVRTKPRRNYKNNENKQFNQNATASVSDQRLLSLRGLINLKKPKQCSNQSPAKCLNRSSRGHTLRRQLRSSTQSMPTKHISPAANRSSPKKLSLRGAHKSQFLEHKQNRHRSKKQKVHARNNRRSDSKHRRKQGLTVKQGSDIDKHRIKSKSHRRRSADSLSVQEALAKQQRVIDEHSKEKEKFEDGNIISALCQLEDRAKTLHSHDLDRLMPMSNLSANRNSFLGVRGEGQNNHPGGVWKKLIPEN